MLCMLKETGKGKSVPVQDLRAPVGWGSQIYLYFTPWDIPGTRFCKSLSRKDYVTIGNGTATFRPVARRLNRLRHRVAHRKLDRGIVFWNTDLPSNAASGSEQACVAYDGRIMGNDLERVWKEVVVT